VTRLLAIALLAILIWLLLDWLIRRTLTAFGIEPRSGRTRRSAPGAGKHRPQGVGPDRAETLVACSACGTYVPASRALPVGRGGDRVACSEACRQRLLTATDAR
jgi:hypothetical protein